MNPKNTPSDIYNIKTKESFVFTLYNNKVKKYLWKLTFEVIMNISKSSQIISKPCFPDTKPFCLKIRMNPRKPIHLNSLTKHIPGFLLPYQLPFQESAFKENEFNFLKPHPTYTFFIFATNPN